MASRHPSTSATWASTFRFEVPGLGVIIGPGAGPANLNASMTHIDNARPVLGAAAESPTIPPHVQRMQDEQRELAERIEKLKAFLLTPTCEALHPHDRGLLREQCEYMDLYQATLSHRIARMTATDAPTVKQILDCPMQENDAGAATVREYLRALLLGVWKKGESFSGKRPFGNSGWETEVIDALHQAGMVKSYESKDYEAGRVLVSWAIESL